MKIEDFKSIEFGICSMTNNQESFVRIPIDNSVRKTLCEMYEAFYSSFLAMEGEPSVYEISEKYASCEKLSIELANENLETLRTLYDQINIPVSSVSLSEIAKEIVYYFGIFHDNNGSKHIAIKRPSQFKGLLKKHSKLVSIVDDTLRVIPDEIFKLDNDYDFIVHENVIEILHPTGFESIADIDEEILASSAISTRQLVSKINFINFNYLADYVSHSKKAAKLIASIKSRGDLEKTSLEKLKNRCLSLNIAIREESGMLVPEDEHIIRFLELLDRRGYDVDLTDDEHEIYVASSRKKLN